MRSTFCLVRHLTSFNWILPPLLLVNTLLTRNKHTHWYRESMQRFTFIGAGSGRLYLFCWWAIFEIQSKRIEFSIECHGIDSVSTLYFILLVGGNVKSTYSLARADTSVCCRKYRTLLCILSSVAHFSFARYCYYFPNNVFWTKTVDLQRKAIADEIALKKWSKTIEIVSGKEFPSWKQQQIVQIRWKWPFDWFKNLNYCLKNRNQLEKCAALF